MFEFTRRFKEEDERKSGLLTNDILSIILFLVIDSRSRDQSILQMSGRKMIEVVTPYPLSLPRVYITDCLH